MSWQTKYNLNAKGQFKCERTKIKHIDLKFLLKNHIHNVSQNRLAKNMYIILLFLTLIFHYFSAKSNPPWV